MPVLCPKYVYYAYNTSICLVLTVIIDMVQECTVPIYNHSYYASTKLFMPVLCLHNDKYACAMSTTPVLCFWHVQCLLCISTGIYYA